MSVDGDGSVTPRTADGDVGYRVFSQEDDDDDDFISEFQQLLGFTLHSPEQSSPKRKKKVRQRGIISVHEEDLLREEEELERQEQEEEEERKRKEKEMKVAIVFLVRVKKCLPKSDFRKFFELLVKLIKAGTEDIDVLKFLRNDAQRVFKKHPDLFEEFDKTFLRLPEQGKRAVPLHPRIGRPSPQERYSKPVVDPPAAAVAGPHGNYSNSDLNPAAKPRPRSLRGHYDSSALDDGMDALNLDDEKPKDTGPSTDFLASPTPSSSYAPAQSLPAALGSPSAPAPLGLSKKKMETVALGGLSIKKTRANSITSSVRPASRSISPTPSNEKSKYPQKRSVAPPLIR